MPGGEVFGIAAGTAGGGPIMPPIGGPIGVPGGTLGGTPCGVGAIDFTATIDKSPENLPQH